MPNSCNVNVQKLIQSRADRCGSPKSLPKGCTVEVAFEGHDFDSDTLEYTIKFEPEGSDDLFIVEDLIVDGITATLSGDGDGDGDAEFGETFKLSITEISYAGNDHFPAELGEKSENVVTASGGLDVKGSQRRVIVHGYEGQNTYGPGSKAKTFLQSLPPLQNGKASPLTIKIVASLGTANLVEVRDIALVGVAMTREQYASQGGGTLK